MQSNAGIMKVDQKVSWVSSFTSQGPVVQACNVFSALMKPDTADDLVL